MGQTTKRYTVTAGDRLGYMHHVVDTASDRVIASCTAGSHEENQEDAERIAALMNAFAGQVGEDLEALVGVVAALTEYRAECPDKTPEGAEAHACEVDDLMRDCAAHQRRLEAWRQDVSLCLGLVPPEPIAEAPAPTWRAMKEAPRDGQPIFAKIKDGGEELAIAWSTHYSIHGLGGCWCPTDGLGHYGDLHLIGWRPIAEGTP